ncbi:glycosyltransferase [Streptomyces clavuligerus]|uniref:dolichyl-phosphate beta-glucosyltransferase n=1 Tax=Streptomyces clavuligerus TaxID=1901 RepID=E2Q9X6_STRCL|nr:glycosyltransferase [Streptomyces clavuligerus]ANW19494.1 glycosyl transferase [Streptomyces clavuligerus]AXU14103.1 glycosyltransferase family 2 protein [Streptomyces clavuligerus]EFG07703.1 Putative glycosyltransferase [Streptomyces clavuligerus]MBY6304088.1 glycosyltransferase family 2 protein [Streptomyces clavuligerus]QCS06874.1 glycosyltransferase family 2 protein [Streptomyces clavuligerus]
MTTAPHHPDPAPVPAASRGDVDLSVVVPAYNEEGRLRPTLDAISAHLSADPHRTWEVIVVDDGSTDGTARVAREAAAEEPRIHVVAAHDGANHGKGDALRRGVLASYGRRVLVTDADLATPIEELDRLDELLSAEDTDAAIGSRAHPESLIEIHQWRVREWLGRMGNRLIRTVAVPGIHDTQCGFKLFDGDKARAAFADSRLNGWGIDVEILRHFRRAGWPVAEVPVRWSHRPGSKVRPLDYGRVLLELLRLRAPGAFPAPVSSRSSLSSPSSPSSRPSLSSVRPVDLVIVLGFLLASGVLYHQLWADLDRGYLADAGQDQNQWEWFFRVTAANITELRNPLFTTLQGHPEGVNLMANTVMLGLSVPLTPVTLLLGPTVTWALVLTGGLAATAVAWYWFIARRLVANRWAAATGAALAAFAPPMISHGNAHPNFLALFMLPVIVDRALRLCEGRRVVRDGVLLGLFTAYQIFLGEEALLLAAMGMVLFALAYAVLRRDVAAAVWRPLLRGTLIGLAVCLPIVGFPLGWQFFGPQSYTHVMHGDNTHNSPLAFVEFAGRSLAGSDATADPLAMNRTEQNAFFGWPLLLLTAVIVVRLRRLALVKALAFTALAAALLSLGVTFRIPFTDVELTGPWRALANLPLFESVIESRVAMICAPVFGILVALATDRLTAPRAARAVPGARPARAHAVRAVGLLAVAGALLPILPTPYPVRERAPVPAFITEGMYRPYLAEGESMITVPLPGPGGADPLHWQSSTGLGFSLAGGYFNGPWGPDRIGIYGATPRHTSNLLSDVRNTGQVPELGPQWRAQARADLAAWRAGVVVLPPQYNDHALYTALEQLLGRPGVHTGGVWVWDVGRLPGNERE